MTKKFKKKMRKTVMTFVLGATSIFMLGLGFGVQTELFILPKADKKVESLAVNMEKYVLPGGTTSIADDGAIECESIMTGIRDIRLPNGNYTLRVTAGTTTVSYPIELFNVYQDMTYTSNVSLGSSTADQRMLVVKYWGDLTINSGVSVTAKTRKKGMYIHVVGNLVNNGTITMTARGANAVGQNVYLLKNGESEYHYVPAVGGAGASRLSYKSTSYSNTDHRINGYVGGVGVNRGTGGGGSGGLTARRNDYKNYTYRSGAGAAGTSYSGGAGGGGIDMNYRC